MAVTDPLLDRRHQPRVRDRLETVGDVRLGDPSLAPPRLVGRFPGEESCLSLVWAVLDLQINNACNGVKLSKIDRQRLYRLRHQPGESEANERRWSPLRLTAKGAEAAAKLQQHWDAALRLSTHSLPRQCGSGAAELKPVLVGV
jgi:hypothetical protein